MLCTLTANPSVDIFLELPRLFEEDIVRVASTRRDAGGKGINVARVFRVLGGESRAACLLGGNAGQWIARRLEEEGIPVSSVPAGGETRTIYNILETQTGRLFRVNEKGPETGPETLDRLARLVVSLAVPGNPFFALSGSAPPGTPGSYYGSIVRRLREKGARVALDCDGPLMAEGLSARPDIIKPNLFELGRLCGRKIGSIEEAGRAARRIVASGQAGMVIVSLGREGALLAGHEGSFLARAPSVEPVSTVGAGDALLAGFLYELSRGRNAARALLTGVAAGTAAVTRPGTCAPSRDEIMAAREKTILEDFAT